MSEDLKVFGKTYSGVTGIQAKDTDGLNVLFSSGEKLEYDIQTVTVTSNTPTVDRAFDNFIFIAQVVEEELPETPPATTACALMFLYVDDNYFPKSSYKGYAVLVDGYVGGQSNLNRTDVGSTSITFSSYTSQIMYKGTWKVIQIELPQNSLYSFATK